MLKFFDDAKLKAAVWWRERKEKAEERKAQRAALAHSEHGHGRFFLLTVPAAATVCAAIVEVYWALLFCIEATGRLDWNFDFASAWNEPLHFIWNFAFNGNAPVLIGLLAATAPIVMISMVWLPVQFAMRGHGAWRRGSLIAAGLLCNAIVIVSGTVVMNHNRQEQVRSALVVEQSADADRAAIAARLQVAQTELSRITAEGNTSNEARAARAGVEGWRTYVREAQSDPDVPAADRQRIARAMGSAEAADRLRSRIEELTVQQATAAPTANTQVTVQDNVGAGMNSFAEGVKVYRPPLIAVACTIIGILGAWWTIAMMLHMNPRDVLRSGWADEGHRIEDLREQAPVESGKVQMQTVMEEEDLNTGEKRRMVTPKPYWRTVKKGKKQTVEVPPEVEADEVGVTADGGNRIARTVAGPIDLDNPGVAPSAFEQEVRVQPSEDDRAGDKKAQNSQNGEHGRDDQPIDDNKQQGVRDNYENGSLQSSDLVQETPPEELGDDDAAYLDEAPVEPVSADEREEPETDERRMIAAE